MAHAHQPAHGSGAAAGHATADDEYAVTPPGSGHEHTDANVWIIVKFGLWLAISAIVIHVGLGVLFGLFVKRSEEATAEFPLAVGQEQRLPAAPRLQQFPVNEYYEFRLKEEAILHDYGWVSKETGVVRMPIEEAMRRAVAAGLPVRATQSGQVQPETTPRPTVGQMPADSSAGRTMERRRQ
jgi:hypothetical protein